MAGALKKSMMWLGLAEEGDAYEEDRYIEDPKHRAPSDAPSSPAASAAVTPIKRERPMPTLVRDTHAHTSNAAHGEISRISTIHPRSYNDAIAIGEHFREGVPVIMNLSDMNEADARRLVDFSAGLVFGLHGSLERVTSKVFLLSPANVQVSEQGGPATNGSQNTGFFNQS